MILLCIFGQLKIKFKAIITMKKFFLTGIFSCFCFLVIHAQKISSTKLEIGPTRGELCFSEHAKENILVIFVPNSGPVDRDGNQLYQQHNLIKKLAEELAEEGFSNFRYDKIISPRRGSASRETVLFDDYINDLYRIIAHFKKQNSLQKIILIGYGEGSLVSLVVAKDNVDAFISLAGYGQSIDQSVLKQLERQVPVLKEQAAKNFDLLRKNKSPKEYHPALEVFFGKDTYRFIQSWMKHQPTEYIAQLEMPILLLHGKRDLQIDFSESELLAEAQPKAKLVLMDDVNHVMRYANDDDMENAKTYNQRSLPLAYEVVEEILDFLLTNFPNE